MMRHVFSLAVAAAMLFGTAAQAQQTRTQDVAANTRASKVDQQVQTATQEKLDKDRFRKVRVSVEDQIVTLTGTVELYAHKLDAERRVRDVRNVSGVRNQIQVTSTVPDEQLREKLAEKLRYDRIGQGVMFNALTLDVNNGVVTIGGNVRDYPDKASALAIAEHQKGVKHVIDQVEVAPASIRDDELRIALARSIYGHPALQRYAVGAQAPIRIVVERGNVALEGVVDTAMDKQVAEVQARSVAGVFGVKNNLVVANSESARKRE